MSFTLILFAILVAPFVEFDLSAMIHSTTESVRLYGTPVLTGGKTLNLLAVRFGLLAVSCCGLVVPGARNTQWNSSYCNQCVITHKNNRHSGCHLYADYPFSLFHILNRDCIASVWWSLR
jgi:hypothetical protein